MKLVFDTYKPTYANTFKDLNISWLNDHFYVEEHDQEVLSNPDIYILKPGGHILVAKDGKKVIGVVALMPMSDGCYELTKMAVDKSYRGKKIGQQLMTYCLEFAQKNNINTLILYSNKKLENAIYIYRKFGFVEVDLEKDTPYERADIKMTLDLS